ncbi:hypothetical protein L1049_021101 [Liquidambar formosana]|uniref:Uncharacterized protein n=1 Tax=Liquidambar formosana TaxID=63359 RepID=A0AAP0S994_LIQFO
MATSWTDLNRDEGSLDTSTTRPNRVGLWCDWICLIFCELIACLGTQTLEVLVLEFMDYIWCGYVSPAVGAILLEQRILKGEIVDWLWSCEPICSNLLFNTLSSAPSPQPVLERRLKREREKVRMILRRSNPSTTGMVFVVCNSFIDKVRPSFHSQSSSSTPPARDQCRSGGFNNLEDALVLFDRMVQMRPPAVDCEI